MSNSQGSHRAARGSRRAGARPPAEAGADRATVAPYGSAPQPTAVDGRAVAPRGAAYAPTLPYLDRGALTLVDPDAGTVPAGAVPSHRRAAVAQAPTLPYVDLREAGVAEEPVRRARARRGGSRRRRPAERPDTLRRLVPQALVVVFLAGGTTAFVADDKAVRLTVDGVPRTMHTFADDVAELLEDEGLDLRPHDVVAPGPEADLDSGDEITVRHGRPLRLTLDGRTGEVWTTATTVGAALRELGVRAEGAYLSVPPSTRIPRTGLALDVRTERAVTFMADGRERTIRTNAATVGEALGEAGIVLRGQDATSVPPGGFPHDGQTVTVTRITGSREVREEPIGFAVEKTLDPALFTGTEVVVRQGRPGVRRVTYALRTVDGVRQKPRRTATDVVREPVTERVKVGTGQPPSSVRGADGLNWAALAECESGGRPGAVDPSGTYGGLYQFDTATWHSLGGTGRPQDAPAEEQTYRAKKLYVQRGASPWPHCGRRLYR
ncbi:ubiquitin-like domain-containing protein [Streptomyces sp. NPDC054847]